MNIILKIRIMRAREGGFVEFWTDHNVADPSRCLIAPRKHDDSDRIRLTLSGLSGAFVVLAFGYSLSILIFLGEVIQKLFGADGK